MLFMGFILNTCSFYFQFNFVFSIAQYFMDKGFVDEKAFSKKAF